MDQPVHIHQSFERFFNEHYAAVLRYCLTIVVNRDEAKDIVQQAFISMWQAKDLKPAGIFSRAYLYKTVYHASLNHLKHEKVKRKYISEVSATRTGSIEAQTGDVNGLQKKIDMTIDALPEQCGKIFRMSRYDNLKYREIAAKLSLSEKTVENQMGKALKILREALRHHLPLLLILIYLYHG